MSIKTTLLFAIAGAIGFALQAAPATAQESATSGAVSESLNEIVVTARKREESLQNVPVVATVVTQEEMQQTKMDDLYALESRVPSLLLGDAVNSIGTQLSLRGVGTMALNAMMDQSVLLDIDGLPLSQSLAYSVGMFDVARAEVFKGPQALFFGKNATAGVISLRSADPTDEVEREVRIGYEDYANEKQADVILSGPVSDSLKLRLATRYSVEDGFFRNDAVALPGLGGVTPAYDNYAPSKEFITRGTALYEPNDSLTARLKVNYENNRVDAGSTLSLAYCPDGTSSVPPLNIGFIAGESCTLSRTVHVPWFDPSAFPGPVLNGGLGYERQNQAFGSLDLNYKLSPSLSLSSVTGYYNDTYVMQMSGNNEGTVPSLLVINDFANREFSEEVRLTSSFADSPVNFMTGAFYQYGHMENALDVEGNELLRLPGVPLQYPYFDMYIHSYSLFGQLTWDITQKLELAGGVRWTDEERTMSETNFSPLSGPIGPVGSPDPYIRSSNGSPELTLTYKPTNTVTAFAAYKTGTKSGSYNGASFVPPTQLGSFGDEKVKGAELGLKTRTSDGRLTAEIAVYRYIYYGLQVGALTLSNSAFGAATPLLATYNAASATTKGVDFDATYAPPLINGLTLNAAVNYNNARYDSFPNAPCGNGQTIAEGCNQELDSATGLYNAQNLAGRPLVRAPNWSGNVGLSQSVFLPNNLSLDFGAGANYVGPYYTVLSDLPGFVQKGYVKVAANVSLLGGKDKNWEFSLIGRNLTNEITSGWCANAGLRNSIFGGQIAGGVTSGPSGGDDEICQAERGRELWGRLSVRF